MRQAARRLPATTTGATGRPATRCSRRSQAHRPTATSTSCWRSVDDDRRRSGSPAALPAERVDGRAGLLARGPVRRGVRARRAASGRALSTRPWSARASAAAGGVELDTNEGTRGALALYARSGFSDRSKGGAGRAPAFACRARSRLVERHDERRRPRLLVPVRLTTRTVPQTTRPRLDRPAHRATARVPLASRRRLPPGGPAALPRLDGRSGDAGPDARRGPRLTGSPRSSRRPLRARERAPAVTRARGTLVLARREEAHRASARLASGGSRRLPRPQAVSRRRTRSAPQSRRPERCARSASSCRCDRRAQREVRARLGARSRGYAASMPRGRPVSCARPATRARTRPRLARRRRHELDDVPRRVVDETRGAPVRGSRASTAALRQRRARSTSAPRRRRGRRRDDRLVGVLQWICARRARPMSRGRAATVAARPARSRAAPRSRRASRSAAASRALRAGWHSRCEIAPRGSASAPRRGGASGSAASRQRAQVGEVLAQDRQPPARRRAARHGPGRRCRRCSTSGARRSSVARYAATRAAVGEHRDLDRREVVAARRARAPHGSRSPSRRRCARRPDAARARRSRRARRGPGTGSFCTVAERQRPLALDVPLVVERAQLRAAPRRARRAAARRSSRPTPSAASGNASRPSTWSQSACVASSPLERKPARSSTAGSASSSSGQHRRVDHERLVARRARSCTSSATPASSPTRTSGWSADRPHGGPSAPTSAPRSFAASRRFLTSSVGFFWPGSSCSPLRLTQIDRDLLLQARLDVVVVARRHVHPALLAADAALALLEVRGVGLVGAHLLRGHDEVEVERGCAGASGRAACRRCSRSARSRTSS